MPEQPAQRKGRIVPAAAAKEQLQPWLPQQCDPADVAALRAVYAGNASEHQQRRAVDFVIKRLCGVGSLPFVPGGEDGRRATDLALGKQQVGIEILNLVATRVNPGGEQG